MMMIKYMLCQAVLSSCLSCTFSTPAMPLPLILPRQFAKVNAERLEGIAEPLLLDVNLCGVEGCDFV